MSVKIFCNIDEYAKTHSIYVIDNGQESKYLKSVECDDVGHTIVTYAKEYNTEEVLLGGASAEFLDRFVDDVYAINALMYANSRNIKVSIVGE